MNTGEYRVGKDCSVLPVFPFWGHGMFTGVIGGISRPPYCRGMVLTGGIWEYQGRGRDVSEWNFNRFCGSVGIFS